MQLEIVVDYRVPADEFDELIQVYPLGRYLSGGRSQWFRVEIDGNEGQISLTWFKEWV